MSRTHWSGTVGGLPVAIMIDADGDAYISTVLAKDEPQGEGDLVAARRRGAHVEIEPDAAGSFEQALRENGFTAEQVTEIVTHLPKDDGH